MIVWGLAAALVVLALDQASKWWVLNVLHLPERHEVHVLPHLEFTMVGNRGVTFGLLWQNGSWGPWLLAGVALAVVALLVVWMRRAERRVTALALGAIAGGAVGNVIDRVRLGHVTDFIRVHATFGDYDYSWFVFNVADAAVVCGVAILVLEGLFPQRQRLQPGTDRR